MTGRRHHFGDKEGRRTVKHQIPRLHGKPVPADWIDRAAYSALDEEYATPLDQAGVRRLRAIKIGITVASLLLFLLFLWLVAR